MLPPLVFEPLLKRIRWGGCRLGSVLQKPIGDEADYAESWEIADHGDDQCLVAAGPLAGWTLQRVVRERAIPLLGRHANRTQFPLLVKFLDASDRLSVQVHPDDRLAKTFDPAANGKTEAWVILDAAPGSVVFSGLKPGVTAEILREGLRRDNLDGGLHRVPVSAGDCLFIPAGTVHAIGEGILLAEIQQSSDLTFRLFDWGRVGADGKPRPLHLEEALRCTDFARGPVDPVQPRAIDVGQDGFIREAHGLALEELVRCDHFVMRRYRAAERFETGPDDRFRVWMTLAGTGMVNWPGGTQRLAVGQTVLLPAECPPLSVVSENPLTLLEAFLP